LVHHYGKNFGPLTNLLNKDAFKWIESEEQEFSALKQAMCTTPFLVVPDFTKTHFSWNVMHHAEVWE